MRAIFSPATLCVRPALFAVVGFLCSSAARAEAPPSPPPPDVLDAESAADDDATSVAPTRHRKLDGPRAIAGERARKRRSRLRPPPILDDAYPVPTTRRPTRTADTDVSWFNVALLHGGTTALSAWGATSVVASIALLLCVVPYIGWAFAAVLIVVGAPIAAGAAAHWVPAVVLDSPRISAVGPLVGAAVFLGEFLLPIPLGAAVVGAAHLYFWTPGGPGNAYATTGFNVIVVVGGTALATAAVATAGLATAFAGGAMVAGVLGFMDGDPFARADAARPKAGE